MGKAVRRALLIVATASGLGWLPAQAADRFYVYNMTTATEFKGIYLAPAGTTDWGRNQTLNDKDQRQGPQPGSVGAPRHHRHITGQVRRAASGREGTHLRQAQRGPDEGHEL